MPVICTKCGRKQRGGKYCRECGGKAEETKRPATIRCRVPVRPYYENWRDLRDQDGHLLPAPMTAAEWQYAQYVAQVDIEVEVDTAKHRARIVGIAKEEGNAQSSSDG